MIKHLLITRSRAEGVGVGLAERRVAVRRIVRRAVVRLVRSAARRRARHCLPVRRRAASAGSPRLWVDE
jgi:hypothetical protein